MTWDFSGDRAIYVQIAEQVKLRIIAGIYPVGTRLPSVRELAAEASVNPNTMQRALSDLEREGLLYSERTSGRFVTEDSAMIAKAKAALAQEVIDDFFARMERPGYTRAAARQQILDTEGENNG